MIDSANFSVVMDSSSKHQRRQQTRGSLAALLITSFIGLSGCQYLPEMPALLKDEPERMVEVPLPTPDPNVELQYHILAGEMAVQRGNRRVAAREYVAALDYSSDPELAQRAARIALFAGESDLALKAAQAWAHTSPDSIDAHKTAARLALRAGNQTALAHHARQVVALHSDGVKAGLRALPEVLAGESEKKDIALATVRSIVGQYNDFAEAHYARGVIALRYEQFDEAEAASAKALSLNPGWPDAVLLRAGVLVRQERVSDAEQLVSSIGGSRADRAQHHLTLARQLLDADQIEAAVGQFERVLELEPDNSDARYGIGLLAMSLEDWTRAHRAFARLYRDGRRRDDSAYYLGNIAAADERYDDARKWYSRVKGGNHLFEAQIRAARTRYHMGDLAAARAEMTLLRRKIPELADRIYAAEGEMLLQAQEYSAALETYDEALAKLPDDPDLLYGRSLTYERQGNIKAASRDLRRILAEEPENPRVLNALGYLLSNHSNKYQEALGYIEKALEAQPDDPAVIDSMGWIHYRLGDLDTARSYLERAYSKLDDPEVAAHLGEVMWQMGDREQARQVWQKSLSEHPEHPVLQETIDRLTR